MNNKGLYYIELVNKYYDWLPKKFKVPFDDSNVAERIMRIGIESKKFGATTPEDWKQIALATLREDEIVRKVKS